MGGRQPPCALSPSSEAATCRQLATIPCAASRAEARLERTNEHQQIFPASVRGTWHRLSRVCDSEHVSLTQKPKAPEGPPCASCVRLWSTSRFEPHWSAWCPIQAAMGKHGLFLPTDLFELLGSFMVEPTPAVEHEYNCELEDEWSLPCCPVKLV